MKTLVGRIGSAILLLCALGTQAAEQVKMSEWIGRIVVTPEGELLGRVEDFALNQDITRVEYVVVSVGSFIIDENLIAVSPEAFGPSSDGRYLVIFADALDQARRFGANSWPADTDVVASARRDPVDVQGEPVAEDAGEGRIAKSGVATISDSRRRATIENGQQSIIDEPNPVAVGGDLQPKQFRSPAGVPRGEPTDEFKRLDQNVDGYLNRREIGALMGRDDRFSDYDVDANGGLDPFEYQVFKGAQDS